MQFQGVNTASAGHAKSQRPHDPTQVDNGIGVADPAEQGLPVFYWEVEQEDTQVIPRREDTLSPASWILHCVREGYRLQLCSSPERSSKPNKKSA